MVYLLLDATLRASDLGRDRSEGDRQQIEVEVEGKREMFKQGKIEVYLCLKRKRERRQLLDCTEKRLSRSRSVP